MVDSRNQASSSFIQSTSGSSLISAVASGSQALVFLADWWRLIRTFSFVRPVRVSIVLLFIFSNRTRLAVVPGASYPGLNADGSSLGPCLQLREIAMFAEGGKRELTAFGAGLRLRGFAHVIDPPFSMKDDVSREDRLV